MIRLGILSVESTHAEAYPSLFNGFTDQWRESYSSHGDSPETIPGARVVALWAAQGAEQRARALMEDFDIGFLATKPEDMLGKVDAVLVLSRSGALHLPLARPFLQAGLPTFVDKPCAEDISDAEEMFSLAEAHNASLFSSSALRFASELTPLKALVKEKAEIWGGCSFGPGNYSAEANRYGIHPVEGMISLVGTGVESVLNVGAQTNHVVRLKYTDGKTVMVITGNSCPSYDFIVWGETWRETASVKNHYQFYRRTMEAFMHMIQTGRPPIPPEETLEIIKIVLAAEQTINTGREVHI